MTNSFTIECKLSEAKGRVANHAKEATNWGDFVYDVHHDRSITKLIKKNVIDKLIQLHAADIA